MDTDLIIGVAISIAIFSIVTWTILRFTSAPGLRVWSFIAVLLLSYPAFFVFAAIAHYFRLPYPASQSPVLWRLFLGAMAIGATILGWMVVRVAISTRRRPRRLVWIASLVAMILLVLGCARYSAVPWRTLDYQAWRATHATWEAGAADDPAANRLSLFVRANLDYLVSPDARFQRLTFHDFWREDPETVYLRFIEDYQTSIIYCYSTREKKFLWKAWWSTHDS